MMYDSFMMARIASDIRRLAVGAQVERVFAVAPTEVVLELRRRMPRPQLVLSWAAESARVHFAGDLSPTPGLTLPIADVLRKHLRGAILTSCQQRGFDRVLQLGFANCQGMGPQSRATLVAEVMGRRANLVLLDQEQRILACAKAISHQVNRYRQVLPGLAYTPPPDFGRICPREATQEQLEAMVAASDAGATETLGSLLHRRLMGASDVFLGEVLARAGLSSEAPTGLLPDGWAAALQTALGELLELAEAEGPGFLYARSPSSAAELAYPVPLRSLSVLQVQRTEDLSAALELLARVTQGARALADQRSRLLGLAQRALVKAEAREEERRRALAEAEDAEAMRREAELILANLHAIPPGAAEAWVTDFYDSAQPQVRLTLDPSVTPQEQAQRLFTRYKRARRAQQRIPALLREAELEREYLQGALEAIERAETAEDLRQLETELTERGYGGARGKRWSALSHRSAAEPARVETPEGYVLLYGRTATQNDALLRMAQPDDLWLHVKDGPGAHVLIRTEGRPDKVPPNVLKRAAGLAAAHSRWRMDLRADVVYTLAKHVRKLPGAAPGLVTYSHSRTITVAPLSSAQEGGADAG